MVSVDYGMQFRRYSLQQPARGLTALNVRPKINQPSYILTANNVDYSKNDMYDIIVEFDDISVYVCDLITGNYFVIQYESCIILADNSEYITATKIVNITGEIGNEQIRFGSKRCDVIIDNAILLISECSVRDKDYLDTIMRLLR